MNATELQAVLAAHAKWLADEPGGERADLSDANLGDANLGWANLAGANLAGANLGGATVWPGWKMVKA